MNVMAKDIAALREKTGLPMMDCKSALLEAGGDEEKAIEILRNKGLSRSEKRAGRATSNGVIDSYIHNGRIGVLVKVLCETDFVARNEDFKNFAHEISLQVAASAPKYLSREQVPTQEIAEEKEIYAQEAKSSGKPEDVIKKIVEGKLDTHYSQVCLLDQPYFRNPKKTITDILNEIIAKTGEKVVISRFARMELSC
ncbi:elongation factor Ts [Candidatus Berkelbacteria bacterium CG_4_9_14_0_2_um_filter_42_30]|uniref:Elongation factor Ts n=6 Tax=Candidatus Berkelbacteria TaxID=1618330 RepID=A0A2M7K1P6_9BACT|nr:MAG: elongation factor Ts [Candidatus Berkelbacteria bacterium CG1_02_42_45]PIP51079.1 MAG: elongation factor Ts [Candidatus Berkelbacteria bacterium CG23_combo_of_CG06-09_8_20_14_all_41_73]PIR27029.1 MAG: elongation factor Ts [Candidatus Berkelbacteria bacterium CG11_big_fil_rev_8_21_14_0_20_42_15]PIX30155.1 MAG: elongation factor Ts [Candidatus Berkelbacteria bacterium CG_4_8_14_3_um_filter_42_13]PIZ27803.1 MAG: elongation factor Ts [Candidatus Berkelbacteria bacterium CG_4_10_14_0_8_um_fi